MSTATSLLQMLESNTSTALAVPSESCFEQICYNSGRLAAAMSFWAWYMWWWCMGICFVIHCRPHGIRCEGLWWTFAQILDCRQSFCEVSFYEFHEKVKKTKRSNFPWMNFRNAIKVYWYCSSSRWKGFRCVVNIIPHEELPAILSALQKN